MHTPRDTQKRIIHRIKIARGRLDKVIEMVEQNEYCIDILHQSQAIQNALREIDTVMLENHLKSCVIEQIRNNKAEESVEEIMRVFKKIKISI